MKILSALSQCSFFVVFSADSEFSGGTEKYKTPVILTNQGKCSWYCPVSFTSTCPINVQYFPFDQQKCVLKFGSWTYEVKKRKNKYFSLHELACSSVQVYCNRPNKGIAPANHDTGTKNQ